MMIKIPQSYEEEELWEQQLIMQEKKEDMTLIQHKFIIKVFCFIVILIILISSYFFHKNNSLNSIEKIKEINNVNYKTNLSIIINSFNEKNDLISLLNKILNYKIEFSEIILTTNYNINFSLFDEQEKECKKNNISTKIIEYKKNTNSLKMRLDSALRSNGEYLIYINPEEPIYFNIFNSYIKIIKENKDIDIIQYDLDFERIGNNKIIYQPQIYESLFFSQDSINFNHFHINGKLYKKEMFTNAIKKLDNLYMEQSDKYYDEIMIVSLAFKEANTFIKLSQHNSCNRDKCQKYLYKNYRYDDKILKDTILFVKFLFEYTGKDKKKKKRMAARIFDELLISRKVTSYYNNQLKKLINETIQLYLNCDLINDIDKDQIIKYKKSIRV